MKIENPAYLTIFGTIIGTFVGSLIVAYFSLLAANIQKKQDDADKAELLAANKTLNDSLNSKNEQLIQRGEINAQELKAAQQELKTAQQEQTDFARRVSIQQAQKSEIIEKLQQAQIDKSETIATLQQKQNEKAEEIARLSTEVSQLSIETLNRLTSKESYCYIRIVIYPNSGSNDNGQDKAIVYLHHSGKYPIKNVRISMVNTDQDVEEDNALAATYNENPQVYHKPDHPYTELIPVMLPEQRLRLKDIIIVRRKQKGFHIAFNDDNNIWYQRILLRNAPEYGIEHDPNIEDFRAQTEVYTLDLNPKLNPIYRHEITTKAGTYRQNNPGEFMKDYFPVGSRVNTNWVFMHWNGNHLDIDNTKVLF